MTAENMFNQLTRSIKNIASKGDLFLYEGKIPKDDRDELTEDCLNVACFWMANISSRPPYVLDFLEKETKEKLSAKERKQMGAFFTPPYISDYIVKNAIYSQIEKIKNDNRVKDKVKKICGLKVCDPAMGGGVFLVSAYDFIMEELVSIEQDKYSIEQIASMAKNTIYGVDINPQAVEFSKFILQVNILKWKNLTKFDEFVSGVESGLS